MNIKVGSSGGRPEWRATIVGAVKRRCQIVDEREIDNTIDLAQKVINWNQLIKRDDLKCGLFRASSLQHHPLNHKTPTLARGLSAV
ncbi:hypothetical protein [Aminobacter sp. BA135]|uniref:hypothetical protein n=1 Tax=Aminobacter sp. BA135 TaxID=537596 RepID=UPI003D78C693